MYKCDSQLHMCFYNNKSGTFKYSNAVGVVATAEAIQI